MYDLLRCPVCKDSLKKAEKTLVCEKNHCYDIAGNGYVNLLSRNTTAVVHGDSKEMLTARRNFLNQHFYDILTNKINEIVMNITKNIDNPVIIDCCCGEGYYIKNMSAFMKNHEKNARFLAYDISKKAVGMAAKRNEPITYFVASTFNVPVEDESIDVALNCFAPFCDFETKRILKKGGYLIGILPGKRHLWQLKELLYNEPYENDEEGFKTKFLEHSEDINITSTIHLSSYLDIKDLFLMTPYFWRTPPAAALKIYSVKEMDLDIDFVIKIYKKV